MNIIEDFKEAIPKNIEIIKNLLENDSDFKDKLLFLKEKDSKAYQICVIGNLTTNLANEDYIKTIKNGKYPTWMCWM
jgi:mannitol/fructose-specific phosphotransferase system IIA component (Ntr-type)